MWFMWFAVVYVFSRSGKNLAGQNDRQGKKVTGQQAFLLRRSSLASSSP